MPHDPTIEQDCGDAPATQLRTRWTWKVWLSLALILMAAWSPANAHEDTLLRLTGTTLYGLPEEYSPASFSYSTRELTIGKHVVIVPEAIWKLFGDTKANPIIFDASWYHDPRLEIPHYLLMSNQNCKVYIDLKTLEIMDFVRDERITLEALKAWKVRSLKAPRPEN